ncbi:MAG: D-amino-acid transaminase [Alphaproteobacteria bacterium]|nr:D-amino-acid transaminase [Alphaproteobacteria bacterium]MBF0249078.1 D-amino-acid transaminase [Alphaproteobacteria bacterium]
MRSAYVNGLYLPHGQAAVHIEDRGFQFADAVYEVIAVQHGHLIDREGHFDRLERSLSELDIPMPMTRRALNVVAAELLRRNSIRFGSLYIQVSRGTAPRDFPFPKDIQPTLVMTAKRLKPFDFTRQAVGVNVITIPDIRWKRCDIKSVGLLAGAMGKTRAQAAGAFEAWQVDDAGMITEGAASNAWIVTADGVLVTRHTDAFILAGITRQTILKLVADEGLGFEERAFSVAEAKGAREAFTSSSTAFIRPVVRIDGDAVGDGRPGPLCLKILELYGRYMEPRA